MKKLFISSLLAMGLLSCGQPKQTAEKAPVKSPEAEALLKNLKSLPEKGYMFGHHDDTNYGICWEFEEGRSDVQSVCGDYPAVISFDLGHIELGHDVTLDKVPFDKVQFSTGPVRPLILDIENDGGMLSLTWQNRPVLEASADDQIVMVFYNEESEDFYIIQETTRGEEQYVLPTNTLPQGEYHFWILLSNEKGQCSKTRYEGTVMV